MGSIAGQYGIFLITMAILSSLRRSKEMTSSLTTKLWFEPHHRLKFYFPFLFLLFFFSPSSSTVPTKFESYNKSIIPFGAGNTGEYSVLRLCIVLPCGRANTVTLKVNIPLYSPPNHAIIHIYSYRPHPLIHFPH